MPPWAGWLVLSLVFVDEVLAVWAIGATAASVGGWPAALLAAVVTVALWWAFASPKAPLGGPVLRPVVKVVVFGTACLGLWWIGYPVLAVALLVFSAAVNGLAQLRGVRTLVAGHDG